MRIEKSRIPITDPMLTPKIWANVSGEMHWFESYLEEVYPGGSGTLVTNALKIRAPHGERTFLPHAYYRHFTQSGRPIDPRSGRWEMFDRKAHEGLLLTFLSRYA